ncbi:MAG: fumarate hydratase C-terminal domain-containing protein [Clostridiaceae bacterium]|nr:fumarate hydratase C-terminal domain-containing protein [Clostridiaceae bacterium]
MGVFHLIAPLKEEDVTQLHIGDTVFISGETFTCRSMLHRWIFEENHKLPLDTTNRNVLIHVGPIVLKEDNSWKLISFMPTSSLRFEKWGAASVKQWGLRMIIGKTTMGKETMVAMMEHKCVHVSPQCVSPNLWIDAIKVTGVDLMEELGSIEATWHMTLNELGPFIVDIDCMGNNLYKEHESVVNTNRVKTFKEIGITPDFQYTKLYGE